MSDTYHLQQFSSAKQTRNLAMRALNLAGKLAPAYMRLDANCLWAAAEKSILLAGEIASEPSEQATSALDQLVGSIGNSTNLNFVGRISAFDDSKRMARNHLRVQALIRSQPSILETVIPEPIFIIGMPRTGTTWLHTLLAQDLRHRTIPYWESFEPIPPVTGPDNRIDRLVKMLEQLNQIAPNYQAIHPMTAESPEECVALFMNEFRTIQFDIQYRVPEYVLWLQSQDATVAYQGYLRQLKIIQHFRPAGERFILKDPAHTLNLKSIVEVFPNAKFIFTHRNPAESLSSICSLYAYTRSLFSDAVDAQSVGKEILNGYWPEGLEDAMLVRRSLSENCYTDVRQADLRENPVDAVRRIYEDLDIDFDETAQSAMYGFLETSAHGPHHRHEHSPEGFGLTAGVMRERMQGYVEDFDL
ncbi:MAG: sulfotransferase [Pseudomonadota bacterium]